MPLSVDARLNRLTPRLAARERATLVLGALKAGTPEDATWRLSMPPSQVEGPFVLKRPVAKSYRCQ